MTTATATHEPITKDQIASEQELVRLNVARRVNQLTNDGDELIQFMLDTVRGEFPDATFAHRRAAARDLAVMNGQLPQDNPQANHQQTPRRLHPRGNPQLRRPHRRLLRHNVPQARI